MVRKKTTWVRKQESRDYSIIRLSFSLVYQFDRVNKEETTMKVCGGNH
jgi:hypothetical protein